MKKGAGLIATDFSPEMIEMVRERFKDRQDINVVNLPEPIILVNGVSFEKTIKTNIFIDELNEVEKTKKSLLTMISDN